MIRFILFLSIDLVACHQISPVRQRTYVQSTIQKPLYLAARSSDLPYRNPFYRETWTKREHRYSQSHRNLHEETEDSSPVRGTRGSRQYDVPQIENSTSEKQPSILDFCKFYLNAKECPPADDGMERFACPSPDRMGRYRCIDDRILCDGFIDCPNAEDEDRMSCMFYKMTKTHLDVLADALLRWARGRY